MNKAAFLFPLLLFALPSCDSSQAGDHGEPVAGENVSTAVIQILPTTPVRSDPALRTENFIANEIASLSMGQVLDRAARDNDWKLHAPSLQNILKVERLEGTDMARITATETGELEGPEIINGVIRAYVALRGESERTITEQQLKALDDELLALSDLVQDHHKELTVLIQQYGIPYFETQPVQLGKTESEMLEKARHKHQELQFEEVLLAAELAALDETSAEYRSLSKKLKTLSRQFENIGSLVDRRLDQTINLSLQQRQYQNARRAYQNALDLLDELKRQQMETRVALKMPVTPLIIRQRPR